MAHAEQPNAQSLVLQSCVAIFLVGALLGGMASAMGILIVDGMRAAGDPAFIDSVSNDNYIGKVLPVVVVIFGATMLGSLWVFLKVRKSLLTNTK